MPEIEELKLVVSITDNARAQTQRLRTELQQVGTTGAATSKRVVQTAPTSGIRCLKAAVFSTSMAHHGPHK